MPVADTKWYVGDKRYSWSIDMFIHCSLTKQAYQHQAQLSELSLWASVGVTAESCNFECVEIMRRDTCVSSEASASRFATASCHLRRISCTSSRNLTGMVVRMMIWMIMAIMTKRINHLETPCTQKWNESLRMKCRTNHHEEVTRSRINVRQRCTCSNTLLKKDSPLFSLSLFRHHTLHVLLQLT